MTNKELRRTLRHAMVALEHLDDMRAAMLEHNAAEHAAVTYSTTATGAKKLVVWLVGLIGGNAEIMHRSFLLKYCGEYYPHLRRLEPECDNRLTCGPGQSEPVAYKVYKNRVMGPDEY